MICQWEKCLNDLIVCFEHTGPHALLLATLLEEFGICYVMVSAAQVQLSLGIRRGKSAPIDARRHFSFTKFRSTFVNKLTFWCLPVKHRIVVQNNGKKKCAKSHQRYSQSYLLHSVRN